MSVTETQPITPQTDAQPAQHLDLLTGDERDALALELTADDGEGQPIDEDEDEEKDGAGQVTASEPAAATDATPAIQEDAAAPPATPATKDKEPDAQAQPPNDNPADAAPQAAAAPAHAQPAAPLESLAAFQYQVPKDHEERVKALEGKFLDLDQKLEDGEIDQQDYNKQLRKLTHEQSALEAVASRAEIAREMAQHAQAQLAQREADGWNQAVQALAGEIKGQDGAFDYLNNAKLSMALGKQVEALMVERGLDPGQPAQGKLELLRQAHRVLTFMKTGKVAGDAAVSKQDAQAAAAQAIKDAAEARKPDLAAVAKSIANVPAADNGAGQGEFAAFDKLSGVKLEAALENMARTNPAAYERYMAEV